MSDSVVGARWRRPLVGKAQEAADPYQLSGEQIETFRRDGYVVLPQITTKEDLATIRNIYDRLFCDRKAWKLGHLFDLVGTDETADKASLPQMLQMSLFAPRLRRTRFWMNAQAAARQLLGPEARHIFDNGIRKPARRGAATPWHQDRAYTPRSSPLKVVTIWLPLEDVSVEMGCMQYIPGSHLGPILEHRSLGGDERVHALEALGVDTSRAKAHPVAAGTAILHHAGTLHYTGPNVSDRVRRGYTVAFCTGTPEDPSVQKEYPWNEGRRTALLERQHAYQEAVEKSFSYHVKKQIKQLFRLRSYRA